MRTFSSHTAPVHPSLPQPEGRGEGLQVESISSGQRCNDARTCNEASIKPQDCPPSYRELTSWWTHGNLGEGCSWRGRGNKQWSGDFLEALEQINWTWFLASRSEAQVTTWVCSWHMEWGVGAVRLAGLSPYPGESDAVSGLCQNSVERLNTLLVSENCLLVWGTPSTPALRNSAISISEFPTWHGEFNNLTAAAWVATEVWVWAPAQHNGLKDLALLQLQHRSQLRLGFNPWPGNFCMPQMQP